MLYELLGFRDSEFPAGIGWHDKIRGGFHEMSLWTLSRALSVPVAQTANLVGLAKAPEWSQRKKLLSADTSANLFRIAQAYHRLYSLFKDRTIVSNWLRAPRRELGALTPIVMLLSQPGTELVMDAISKIKPLKTIERAPETREKSEEDETSTPGRESGLDPDSRGPEEANDFPED